MTIQLVDFYPQRSAYLPGDTVCLALEIQSGAPFRGELRWSVTHLDQIEQQPRLKVELAPGDHQISLEWAQEARAQGARADRDLSDLPPDAAHGYGAHASLYAENGHALGGLHTAFDLLPGWVAFPRYGFLTDFQPDRAAPEQVLDHLKRYHTNGLQFYDWQYRHDQLVAPLDEFSDPLGRRLSLPVIRRCIQAAQGRGMAAMAYLAVYAASLEFWQAHQDWALYGADGKPLSFAGFLGLMDPTPGSPWAEHLLAQCEHALTELAFDGLHVDQYGEPKLAYNARGQAVDLPEAFRQFVDRLKSTHPDKAVVFNAVGNWPIDDLARSRQDFSYIEVWPPDTRYADLRRIVANAREKSPTKGVVVALYQPSEWEANLRLADALLLACGATRIEIGEDERLLTDPYFPRHRPITPGTRRFLRRYLDFAVQYGEWLGPSASSAGEEMIEAPAQVWAVGRQAGDWLIINLVNASGLEEARWDAQHTAPLVQENVPITLRLPGPVEALYWASPDRGDPSMRSLGYTKSAPDFRPGSHSIQLNLPSLEYWSLLAIHLQRGV